MSIEICCFKCFCELGSKVNSFLPSAIVKSNGNMKAVNDVLATANQACQNDGSDDEALRTCKKQVEIAIRLFKTLTAAVKKEQSDNQPLNGSAGAVVPVSSPQEPQPDGPQGPQPGLHRLDYTCLQGMTQESIADFFDHDGADIQFELEQAKLHPWFPAFVSYVKSNGADDDWEFGTLTKNQGK